MPPRRPANAHSQLVDESGSASVCSIPISFQQQVFAVLCLERSADAPFSNDEVLQIEQLCALMATQLHMQFETHRSWLRRSGRYLRKCWRRLRARGEHGIKLKVALLCSAVLILAFAKIDYKVSAPAVVEGSVQRVIVAPQDGFLAETSVRAGDTVSKGQTMGALDSRDLRLEQLSIASEQQELLGTYREAMAKHENAKVSVISAQIDQANARMELVNEQLRRIQLQAPFAGVVIHGDLSQQLGAPVSKGDVLFKVAPLDDYRIILEVDEASIAAIEKGLSGKLALTSFPGEVSEFEVVKTTAVSVAEDSRNFFRVEARLLQTAEGMNALRPGMEGVAKVVAGKRNLWWVWTHSLTDWLRLKTWGWLP